MIKIKQIVTSLLMCAAAVLPATTHAQTDSYLFNHLGVGVHAATTGFGIEVATPITRFVTARAGVSFMPGFSFNTDFDGTYQSTIDGTPYEGYFNMDVNASIKRAQGSLIFNVYPAPRFSSFFVAVGAYFGGARIVGLHGHSDELVELAAHQSYIDLGDYRLPVDRNGNVTASLRSGAFRPYVGLGFQRPVPYKRLNFGVELGVQYMGHMKVYNGESEIEPSAVIDSDDTWQKVIDKAVVYPVLKFTLSGKIF